MKTNEQIIKELEAFICSIDDLIEQIKENEM